MYELLEQAPRRSAWAAVALCSILAASPAAAAEGEGWQAGDFNAKLSAVGFLFDSEAAIDLAGAPFDGAGAKVEDGISAATEFEYFLTSELSVAVNFGLPLETDINGTGLLAGLVAGQVDYGIGATTLRYHVDTGSAFVPYVGAGLGRLFIFDESDGAVAGLEVEGAWAPVVQGGASVFLGEHLGLYANVSYAPLDTEASGLVMGLPAEVEMTLDPTVVQGGLFYRF